MIQIKMFMTMTVMMNNAYVTRFFIMSLKSHMVKCRKTLPKVLNLKSFDFENFTFLESLSSHASIKYQIIIYFVVFNVFFVQI